MEIGELWDKAWDEIGYKLYDVFGWDSFPRNSLLFKAKGGPILGLGISLISSSDSYIVKIELGE